MTKIYYNTIRFALIVVPASLICLVLLTFLFRLNNNIPLLAFAIPSGIIFVINAYLFIPLLNNCAPIALDNSGITQQSLWGKNNSYHIAWQKITKIDSGADKITFHIAVGGRCNLQTHATNTQAIIMSIPIFLLMPTGEKLIELITTYWKQYRL